jgi:hypothetical protein
MHQHLQCFLLHAMKQCCWFLLLTVCPCSSCVGKLGEASPDETCTADACDPGFVPGSDGLPLVTCFYESSNWTWLGNGSCIGRLLPGAMYSLVI